MSEIWYRADWWGNKITEVEVVYSTDHFVMLKSGYSPKGKRMARVGTFGGYFPTYDEAVQNIIERAKRLVEIAQADLEAAHARLARVEERYHG